MVQHFLHKRNSSLGILALGLLFIPYIVLAVYAHPVADDMNYALKGGFDNDFWYQWKWEYLNWNGRYFSNILVLANPIGFGMESFYNVVPVILIVLTVLSFRFFLLLFSLNPTQNWIGTLGITLLYLFQMPTIAEGIYWYTGAVTYQLGNIFGLTYITLILRYYQNGKSINLWMALPLLIMAAGSDEVQMLLLVFFHACLFFFQRKEKVNWILLFVAITCFLLVALAPGNATRAHFFEDTSHDFFRSAGYTLLQTARFSFYWLTGLPLIIASVLFVAGPAKNLLQHTFINKITKAPLVFSTALPFLIIAITVFPTYWSTGKLGQHRTLNVAYFFFLLTWFYNLLIWVRKYEHKNFQLPASIYQIAFWFLILSMGLTKNGYDASTSLLFGEAKAFDKELTQREYILSQSRGEARIEVPLLEHRPPSLFVLDIDEGYGVINESYGLYYGVEQVIGSTD